MIKNFKPQLEKWAFQRSGRSDFFLDQAPLRWWIGQTRLAFDDARFRINLGITIQDPFTEDDGLFYVCLSGELEPGGICVHFDHASHWWRQSEAELVRPILEKCSMPFFRYWSVYQLIDYFQNPPANVLFRCPRSARAIRPAIDKRLVNREPPNHDRWLALLFYHLDDYRQALYHAEVWYEQIKDVRPGEDIEPQRTKLLIKTLRKAPGRRWKR